MERVNRIINDQSYKKYVRANRQAEEDRKFCRHHFDHLLTVARLTWLLLLEQGPPLISREIAYAAGLLHDIGRWREYTENVDHALTSAALARPLLEKAGFTPSESDQITEAITGHRNRGEGGYGPLNLSKALSRADSYSRTCFDCPAGAECNKRHRRPHREKLLY